MLIKNEFRWKKGCCFVGDTCVIIAPRKTNSKITGNYRLVRYTSSDEAGGGVIQIHIDDSTVTEPVWLIHNTIGHEDWSGLSINKIVYNNKHWWALKIPAGTVDYNSKIIFSGFLENLTTTSWDVIDCSLVEIIDFKTPSPGSAITQLLIDNWNTAYSWGDHSTYNYLTAADLPVGDKNYVHNQNTPLASWTINHNLNKFPSVTVVDSGGSEVTGSVEHIDQNNIIISFASGFSGKAYIN